EEARADAFAHALGSHARHGEVERARELDRGELLSIRVPAVTGRDGGGTHQSAAIEDLDQPAVAPELLAEALEGGAVRGEEAVTPERSVQHVNRRGEVDLGRTCHAQSEGRA